MKKIIYILVLILTTNLSAQNISSSKWSDLFSYNNILAIREDNGKLIAATENGIFFYTPSSGEITKLSKANGLHEVKISAFDYDPQTKIGLVGYQNGTLDLITPEGILLIVDIPFATGYIGNKKINHIAIMGNKAVISVGYGISIFNLDKKEFGDTTFFIKNGVYEAAKEAVIKDNVVYAATETGIKSHEINVTLPIYSTWSSVVSGNFSQIAYNSVMAFSNGSSVQYGDGATFTTLSQSFSTVSDILVTSQNIIVSDQTRVSVFNLAGGLVKSYDAQENINTGYFSGNEIYAGTKLSGIYNESGNSIKPDGPYNNTSYKLNLYENQIIISSGGRTGFNDPIYNDLGYYHFDGTKWQYPEYFVNNPINFNVLDAVINPAKPSEIFFCNYVFNNNQKGIYKMIDGEFANIYLNTTNPYLFRLTGLTFDENNRLFAAVSFLPDSKIGFYYYNSGADNFILRSIGIVGGTQKPISNNGYLYIPSPFFGDGGLTIYNYNNTPDNFSDDQFKILKLANNLPANGTVSVAIDKNEDVWIGTRLGLRILQNPTSAILEENPQTEEIIIEENGIGEELFRDNTILQISVDSGNQKWVSVDGGGVFYLSSNGEQTLQHFTKANSPLPTDSVTDIKVDPKTGKIYFVTYDGVVVYQGDVLDVNENFGNVLVYPNPVVYANYKGNVRIRGLAQKTNIRITDAAGNLVHQAVARGGYYEWDMNNQRGVRVASGIYFLLMTNEDGTDTATAKIAVVN